MADKTTLLRTFVGTKFQHNSIFGKTEDKEPLGGSASTNSHLSLLLLILIIKT